MNPTKLKELEEEVRLAIAFAVQGVQELSEPSVQQYLAKRSEWITTETERVMQLFTKYHTEEVERLIDISSVNTLKAEHSALYDLLPTGDVDAWNLIKAIQAHMAHLEDVIEQLALPQSPVSKKENK